MGRYPEAQLGTLDLSLHSRFLAFRNGNTNSPFRDLFGLSLVRAIAGPTAALEGLNGSHPQSFESDGILVGIAGQKGYISRELRHEAGKSLIALAGNSDGQPQDGVFPSELVQTVADLLTTPRDLNFRQDLLLRLVASDQGRLPNSQITRAFWGIDGTNGEVVPVAKLEAVTRNLNNRELHDSGYEAIVEGDYVAIAKRDTGQGLSDESVTKPAEIATGELNFVELVQKAIEDPVGLLPWEKYISIAINEAARRQKWDPIFVASTFGEPETRVWLDPQFIKNKLGTGAEDRDLLAVVGAVNKHITPAGFVACFGETGHHTVIPLEVFQTSQNEYFPFDIQKEFSPVELRSKPEQTLTTSDRLVLRVQRASSPPDPKATMMKLTGRYDPNIFNTHLWLGNGYLADYDQKMVITNRGIEFSHSIS